MTDEKLNDYIKKHPLSPFSIYFKKENNKLFLELLNRKTPDIYILDVDSFSYYMYLYFKDDDQIDIDILLHVYNDEVEIQLNTILKLKSVYDMGEDLYMIPYEQIDKNKIKFKFNDYITPIDIDILKKYIDNKILNKPYDDIENIFIKLKKLKNGYFSYINNTDYLKLIKEYIINCRFTNINNYFNMGKLIFENQYEIYKIFHNYRYYLISGGTGIGKTAIIPILYYHYLRELNIYNPNILICEPRISTTKGPFKYLRKNTGTDYIYSFNDIQKIYQYKNITNNKSNNLSSNNLSSNNKSNNKPIPTSQFLNLKYYKNSPIQMQYRGHQSYNDRYAIKFVTDGILYNRLISNPHYILKHNLIVIDEVHENSINSLFSLVIISSYLENDEEINKNEYKNFHVMLITALCQKSDKLIFHSLLPGMYELDSLPNVTKYKITEIYKPNSNVEDSVIIDKNGLVFVPNEMAIDSYVEKISKKYPILLVIKLTRDTNLNIYKGDITSFLNENALEINRKYLIISTNVAESSITFPDLDYIIDLGLQFNRNYDPITKITTGVREYMTINSSAQRKGRVGRQKDGLYIRLYDQSNLIEYKNKILCENISMQLISVLCTVRDNNIRYKIFDKLKNNFNAKDIINIYLDDLKQLKWIYMTSNSIEPTDDLKKLYKFHKKIEIDYNNNNDIEDDEILNDDESIKSEEETNLQNGSTNNLDVKEENESNLNDDIIFQLTVLMYYCYIDGTIKLLLLYLTRKLTKLLTSNEYKQYANLQLNKSSDIIVLIKYLQSYNLDITNLKKIIEKRFDIKSIKINDSLNIINKDINIFDAIKKALYFKKTNKLQSNVSIVKSNNIAYVLELTKDIQLYHLESYIRDDKLNF